MCEIIADKSLNASHIKPFFVEAVNVAKFFSYLANDSLYKYHVTLLRADNFHTFTFNALEKNQKSMLFQSDTCKIHSFYIKLENNYYILYNYKGDIVAKGLQKSYNLKKIEPFFEIPNIVEA